LKWHPPQNANRDLEATKAILDAARIAGWCTPRWIALGTLPDGREYVIEEKIESARPSRSDAHDLGLVLEANRLQANRHPTVSRDWSRYIWRVLWEDASGSVERLRRRIDTAELVRRVMDLNVRNIQLPTTDLVHGDCVLQNVLIHEDRPCFIDAEHAGKGTRAYDLATMLLMVTVGGWHDPAAEEVRRRYESESVAIAGRPGFTLCVTSSMIEFVSFGLDHWTGDVPACVTRCHRLLDRIAAAS